MVFFVVNEDILRALRTVRDAAASGESVRKIAESYLKRVNAVSAAEEGGAEGGREKQELLIDHRAVGKVAMAAGMPVKELLRHATVRLTDRRPPVVHRSKELEARLEKLRRALEEKQYRNMVKDVVGAFGSDRGGEGMDMASMRNQMSVGMNVLVTMATCFVAGYFVAFNYYGDSQYGLLGGLAGLILALVVEGTLVITRVYGIEKSREKMTVSGKRRSLSFAASGNVG